MTCFTARNLNKGISGFTLIELLVVIMIVGLLISLTLPLLGKARESARTTKCQSNLRQMAMAAMVYTHNHNGRFPISQYLDFATPPKKVTWEITTVFVGGGKTYIPGSLWDGEGVTRIHQCPTYDGPDNWSDAPYSGYNYNTSYIGHGQGESIETPANEIEIRNPTGCALFGDGGYGSGANKFMRAPWKNPGDDAFSGRYAGTQAFRHQGGSTNVAYCDGHIASSSDRFTDTYAADQASIAPDTGFLSADNSAYDLN